MSTEIPSIEHIEYNPYAEGNCTARVVLYVSSDTPCELHGHYCTKVIIEWERATDLFGNNAFDHSTIVYAATENSYHAVQEFHQIEIVRALAYVVSNLTVV